MIQWDATGIVQWILNRIQGMSPKGPDLSTAFKLIGLRVVAQAKINARSQGIIDRGALINSIAFRELQVGEQTGLVIGSFGIPYGALNEFGGPFTDKQRRAMFASLRARGLTKQKKSKGVIVGNHWRARPFLRPALQTQEQYIAERLRDAFQGK